MTDDKPENRDPGQQHCFRLVSESDATHGVHEPSSSFPHEKLDAYRVALEMVALASRIVLGTGRGNRHVADHLLRSASNVVLLLAEGANRRGDGEKRQRFVESRGECSEVAAAADLLLVLELSSPAEVEELKSLASRVAAMLTGLIGRYS
jgi:four helix bundle protein